MTDLPERLRDGAAWVEANARYHFQEHQKHDPLRQSLDAAEAMREAATILRAASIPKVEPIVAPPDNSTLADAGGKNL